SGITARVTARARSRLRANICVPAGRLCPDLTTEGGIESQIGAAGISPSERSVNVFMRSAATSSSLTAIAMRLDCSGKNEIRLSGVLPASLQKELLHLPSLSCTYFLRLFQSKRPLSNMYLPIGAKATMAASKSCL